jgi:hypothetical protein
MIDYQALSQIQSPTARVEAIAAAVDREEYIPISDAILAAQLGNPVGPEVLKHLASEGTSGLVDPRTGHRNPALRRTYRLRCLFDEFGTEYKPDDVIEWKSDIRTRDRSGRKYTSTRKKNLSRQGLEHEFRIYHSAPVEADGCILVEFQDASILLNQYGVHYSTGLPISRHKEHGSLRKAPDGSMKHKRNWRYVEVLPGTEADAAVAVPAKRGRRKSTPAVQN